MRFLKKFLFVALMLLPWSSFAYTPSEGNVTAIFGTYIYKTDYPQTATGGKSPYLGGLGFIVLGDINDKGSLEIALFNMHKHFFREDLGRAIIEQTQTMHITMGYRRWINPYFATSLAFYSAYSMGDPEIIHSDFTKATQIDTSARDITEYGLDFSVQGDLWNGDEWAAVAEFRYSLSLTYKEMEKADHYGIFIGARHLVQEKVPISKGKKK